jgi:tripartite-type tricarboxylate transporter receptor subunit TctC
MKTRVVSFALSLGFIAAVLPVPTPAQSFPVKPITLVVTVPAGGSIDAVARLLASDMGAALGQPVVVMNRAGAGGNIAAEYVAKSPPDGHTLLITSSSTLVLNPYVYKSLPFDPERSFVPIGIPAQQNLVLVVHPKLNISTLNEFVALLKAQPGKLNYASSGSGTVPHLAAVMFSGQTATSANHIPYKGIAPAMNALLSGEVDFMFDSASTIGQIRAGKLKALAVIGPKRLASIPDVASFRELGLPGMETARGWYGIFAAAGTPSNVTQRLNREMVRVMSQPAVMEKVSAIGLENATSTPEGLGVVLREDLKRYAPVVRQANVTVE